MIVNVSINTKVDATTVTERNKKKTGKDAAITQ